MTISYIAETAGVSVPTVSKVINGRAGVSAGTRARIEALIDEYGYQKSSAPSRSAMVDLVFDELESMWGVEIIRGVQRAARQNRVGVVLSEFGPQGSAIRYWIDDALDRRPACVVTVAQLGQEERDRLRARGIPFVVFDPTVELPDDVPFVGATNWAGGRSATRHLTGLGHRRVAVVAGPDHVLCCRARYDGYRAAMEAADLPVDPALVVRADLTREAGHAAARGLLALPDRPTAVVAGNDLQALGVYQAAREAGLRIPEDLSVVGFDDLPVAALVDPPLTTVHQPLVEMAAAATELALALGRGERPAQVGLELATTLTVRRSTAPPGGAR
ncbi:LacI family transcriptional regulator [Saccharothrix syringae]|uniref:LacI family transcriptional regulator n=1 Tax=Saccharothrix syringae TaxID=103733 RepID=A0A5Q0HG17_SACSY|nr:LacI family transcriptional regulator [Saccharothrix syringae]